MSPDRRAPDWMQQLRDVAHLRGTPLDRATRIEAIHRDVPSHERDLFVRHLALDLALARATIDRLAAALGSTSGTAASAVAGARDPASPPPWAGSRANTSEQEQDGCPGDGNRQGHQQSNQGCVGHAMHDGGAAWGREPSTLETFGAGR